LINTDQNSKNEYYNKVRMMQTQKEELNKVKSEMDNIKNDVGEIKELILKLLEKSS